MKRMHILKDSRKVENLILPLVSRRRWILYNFRKLLEGLIHFLRRKTSKSLYSFWKLIDRLIRSIPCSEAKTRIQRRARNLFVGVAKIWLGDVTASFLRGSPFGGTQVDSPEALSCGSGRWVTHLPRGSHQKNQIKPLGL